MGMRNNSKFTILKLSILYIVFLFFVTYARFQLTLSGDEFGGLALPSTMAGNDWGALIQDVNYYGYGFRWIYFILFVLSDNPAFIYTGILIIHIIIMSLLYTLSLRMLNQRDMLQQLGLALTFVFYLIPVAIGTKSPLYSEYSLFMATVLWAMTMVKLLECKTKASKRILSGVLAFLLVYMLTLHERSLAFIMAFVLTVVIDWIYEKKCFVAFETAIPVYLVFNFIQEKIKGFIIQGFWGEKLASGDTVGNTEVTIANPTWFLESKKNFKILLDCIASNIVSETIVSLGIYLLMFVFAVYACGEFFRKEKKWKDFYEENHILFLFLMVSFFTISATIVGISLDWGKSVAVGNIYGYKGYAYVRYYNVWSYVGMFAQLVLLNRILSKINPKKLAGVLLCIFAILTSWFYFFMWPVLKSAIAEIGNSMYFERIGIFSYFTDSIDNSIIFTILLGVLLLSLLLTKKHGNKVMVFCMVVFVSIGLCGFKWKNTDIQSKVDTVYEVFQDMEDICRMPKVIYYLSDSRESRFLIQFTLSRYSVEYCLPDESLEEAIVITNNGKGTYSEYLLEQGYTNIVLDDGKYLWAKGKDYQDALETYQKKELAEIKTIDEELVSYGENVKVIGKTIYQTEPGVIITNWLNRLTYGRYHCTVTYEAQPDTKPVVLDIYSNGEKVDSMNVTVDKDGRARADFTIDSRYMSYLYYTLSSDTKIKLKNLKTEYFCEEKYSSFGNGTPEEFELLQSYMDQLKLKKPVRFLSYYNIIELDSDVGILKDFFDTEDISVWDYKKISDYLHSEEKYSCIVLSVNYSENMIFDLIESHDIICVTEHYVLLAYRDDSLVSLEKEKNILPFNKNNSLSLCYLRQNGTEVLNVSGEILLPTGCYDITVETSDSIEEELFTLIRENGVSIKDEYPVGKAGLNLSYIADGTTKFSLNMNSSDSMQNNRVYITRTGGLRSGDIIDFRKTDRNNYTGSRVYAGDKDGAWTSKKKTAMNLPIDQEGDVTLSIRMKAVEKQQVEIYAGDELIETFEVGEAYDNYEVCIPQKYIENHQLELSVRCLVLYELPEELLEDHSSDMKKIGIKMQSIEVK